MSRIRPAETVLRLLTDPSRQQFVCRACRAHAVRHLHNSRPLAANMTFSQRIRDSIFGSKEEKDATKRREEAQQKKKQELAERRDALPMETMYDRKGNEYDVAPFADPELDKGYVVATTWDGLERVGSEEWVKAKADQGEQYLGFAPKKRMQLTDAQWESILHNIFVEVLTLKSADRDVNHICAERPGEWSLLGTQATQINTGDGTSEPSLRFSSREEKDSILGAIPVNASPGQAKDLLAKAIADGQVDQYGLTSSSWMDAKLQDPILKLSVVKRVLQLTGRRIPDPAISASNTVRDLFFVLRRKEKPKKLAQSDQLKSLDANLPNVKVYGRRQTPIDKEKEVGRWKVIEEELIKRDLPVTGSRWQGAKTTIVNQ